ncbi:MAG: CoA pyrophosphatase [Rhodobacteraceae bacterium]|nr:CoA pyrophosphatase [Paracoccaceae bacterium]
MPQHEFHPDLRASLLSRLSAFEVRAHDAAGLRRAAVALVVAPHPETGQASVIVTLRPDKMRRHGAQYALPGGRLEVDETPMEAALRETGEELGLHLNADSILGQLDDYATRSGFCITPYVAWGGADLTLTPDPSEVAQVFHLTFDELNSPDIPNLELSAHGPEPVMSAFFPTLGHYMFAPTAAILFQFREIALHARSTRVAHFDQPVFAWS